MFGDMDGVHGYLTCCRCRRRACRRRRPKWYMASGLYGVPIMTQTMYTCTDDDDDNDDRNRHQKGVKNE